jgi:TetR/AcrR family transcriptional regulator
MADRLDEILDAAYKCLRRSGVRRTSMDDIARELGTSRTMLYQYVRSTDDAFQRLAQRFLDEALLASRRAVESEGPLAVRLAAALEVKLNLTLRVRSDAPEHAAEFLGEHARLSGEMTARYNQDMQELVLTALRQQFSPSDAAELSGILLALTRGLEPLNQGSAAVLLLRRGVARIVDHNRSDGTTA